MANSIDSRITFSDATENLTFEIHIRELLEREFNRLEPLQISQLLLGNSTTNPLTPISESWLGLYSALVELLERFDSTVKEPLQHWQGSSAHALKYKLDIYKSWLYYIALAVDKTYRCAINVEEAYFEAFINIVPLGIIISNRTMVNSLKMANFYGMHDANIAELNDQHEKWRIQNIQTMRIYCNKIIETIPKLPNFPDVPEISNRSLNRYYRSR